MPAIPAVSRRAITIAETDFILTTPWTSYGSVLHMQASISYPLLQDTYLLGEGYGPEYRYLLPVVLILEVQQDQMHRPIVSLKEPENITYYVQMYWCTWENYRIGVTINES
jgi:hypothetical protein